MKARLAGYRTLNYLYLIVALSTERLHRPVTECVQEPDQTTSCGPDGPILETLPPGGALSL